MLVPRTFLVLPLHVPAVPLFVRHRSQLRARLGTLGLSSPHHDV